MEGRSPFIDSPAARPFLEISRWLDTANDPPSIVVLENVKGLIMGSPAPIEFIMNGYLDVGGKRTWYGLRHLKRYIVSDVARFSSGQRGLPMKRARVFIVLLRKDLFTASDMLRVQGNLALLDRVQLVAKPLNFYSIPDCDDLPRPDTQKMRTMTRRSTLESEAFRKKHNLPSIHSSRGRPFSSTASASLRASLSARELDVLDVASLLFTKTQGAVPTALCTDVSQSVARHPWTIGSVRSLHSGSKLVIDGRLASVRDMFEMMGWPADAVTLPADVSRNNTVKLLGNMIAPPVFGGVAAAIFASVSVRPSTDFRSEPARAHHR